MQSKDQKHLSADPFIKDRSPAFYASLIDGQRPMEIVPSTSARAWMESMPHQLAHRCLPLLIANQSGWTMLCPVTTRAIWYGGDSLGNVQLEFLDGDALFPALSHFGSGILTWNIPYIFRTPPGVNLLVRGPANLPKDGICPLEGLVETDWSVTTFTMNWKFTKTNLPVIFERGEPICMIVPQRRGDLEEYSPSIRRLSSDPQLEQAYQERTKSNGEPKSPGSEAVQKDFRGATCPIAVQSANDQTKLALRPFEVVMSTADGVEEERL